MDDCYQSTGCPDDCEGCPMWEKLQYPHRTVYQCGCSAAGDLVAAYCMIHGDGVYE